MRLNQWVDKPFLHRNITVRKGTYFAVTGGVGAAVTLGLIYALTEWAGWWYMTSAVAASIIALLIKFVITAIWVFK